jgi:FkbM family methyltransferase
MNKFLQNRLIGLYGVVKSTGVLNTTIGRRAFEASYELYKERLEAGPIQLLRPLVRPGTYVVDVGANVGFFTRRFAAWVSEGGKVLAIEPEDVNYSRLAHAIRQAGLEAVVETIKGAVAETTGQGWLEINPRHPGDHKLGKETGDVRIDLWAIDDLLAARGWPEVSLIKVDVQGAEARVLAGAAETIKRYHPALFLELDDQHLKRYGSSSAALLSSISGQGYTIHTRVGKTLSQPLGVDEALALGASRAYDDFLLVPSEKVSRSA